jgi:ssDNA-binding Zn-finger/Zn-ribbon topoisomerase 1
MDVKFTSYMEEELDKIEEAHLDWLHVLGEFYEPFKTSLERAEVEMERPRAEPSEYSCPECGKQMVYRLGRNGRFLACSGYPDCKVARNIDEEGKPVEEVVAEQPCTLCGKPMVLRKSRLGPFLGCTGYPECTNTLPCDEEGNPLRKVLPEEIRETCDDCGSAMSVKFARGRAFLGCTKYPECKATKPIPPGLYVEKPKPQDAGARCDKCGRAMVIRKGRRGPFLSCSGFPRCRNAMPMEKLDHLKALEQDGKIPDPPPESANGQGRNGNGRRANGREVPRDENGKVDLAALGPPPPGFAWTRTGREVVETWPEEPLTCPVCGSEVALKNGRFGPYYGCTTYPKCSFVANLRGEAKKRAEAESPRPVRPKPIPTDIPCDECGAPMVIRTGRTGPFLGCSKYPKCRHSRPLPEGETAETLATSSK